MTTGTISIYDQVVTAYRARDFNGVERLLAPIMASGQMDINLVEILAAMRMQQGRFADAEPLFRAVLEARGPHAQAALNLASALYKLGKIAESNALADRAAQLDDNLTDAHFLAAMTTGHSDPIAVSKAQQHLKRVTELRPDWHDGFLHYGQFLQSSSKEPETEAAFRRALEINEASWQAHEGLANLLLDVGRLDEALVSYERAVELNPNAGASRAELSRLRSTNDRSRDRLARYPRSTREFADVDKFIEKYLLVEFRDAKPFLTLQTPIFTLGSCFALNVAKALQSFGVPALSADYPEDINNTYANLQLLNWLIDPATPGCEPYAETLGEERRVAMGRAMEDAKAIIVSLGVAPAFFDRETGDFVLTFGSQFTGSLWISKYQFRTTSVQENVTNLKGMIAIMRKINPGVKVILTVSPVPLKATFERPSAVVADCVSKSTLRVAAHEIMQSGLEDVLYWPSFEMVRWMGAHTGGVFGVDDDSPFHVSQALIKKIMYAFIRIFGRGDVLARAEAALASST